MFSLLNKIIKDQFQISPVDDIVPLNKNTYNEVFLVRTIHDRRYVITKYHARGFRRSWLQILYLLQQLKRKDFVVSDFLYHTQNQIIYIDEHKNQYTMTNYIPGYNVHDMDIMTTHCYLVGQWLGRLQAQKIPFDVSMDIDDCQMLRWIQQLAVSDICEKNAQLLKLNLADIRRDLNNIDRDLQIYKDQLPQGWLHADLFSGNVIFNDNKMNVQINGIIDWEFASYDFLWIDLLIGLHAWCFNNKGYVQPARVHAWWQGATSVLDRKFFTNKTNTASCFTKQEQLQLWICLGKLSCYRIILMRLYNYQCLHQDLNQYQRILQYYHQEKLLHLQPLFHYIK